MPKGMVTVPFNPQLINTGSKLVLIDCGNGVANFESRRVARSDCRRCVADKTGDGAAFALRCRRIFSRRRHKAYSMHLHLSGDLA